MIKTNTCERKEKEMCLKKVNEMILFSVKEKQNISFHCDNYVVLMIKFS